MPPTPKTSETHPIQVDFIPRNVLNLPGRLGLTFAPGKRDPQGRSGPWERDPDRDLWRLRHECTVELLVLLLERGEYGVDEYRRLGIANLPERTRAHGIEVLLFPIPDGSVPPSVVQLIGLTERIICELRAERTVILACRRGRGRSGMVASACLVALGASVPEALNDIRDLRSGAVGSAKQESFLTDFDKIWRDRAILRASPTEITDPFDSCETTPPRRLSAPRVARTGEAPLSYTGAANVVFLGIAAGAMAAGVTDPAPLRAGDTFHIMPDTLLSIGRDAKNDIVIASGQLSRFHVTLQFVPAEPGRLIVTDLASRNGTWAKGERRAVHFLTTGEEIELARAFRFRFESVN